MKKLQLYKRHFFDKFFKLLCYLSSSFSILFLFVFLAVIILKGYGALYTTKIRLEIPEQRTTSQEEWTIKIAESLLLNNLEKLTDRKINFTTVMEVVSVKAPYEIYNFVSNEKLDKNEIWVNASAPVCNYFNKHGTISENAELIVKELIKQERISNFFNWNFFTDPDSSESELAGIGGSIMGSIMILIICMITAFPLGLITAIYLEEFAPKNFITHIIEVNITNLAAVPSIVFGLLGLSIFVIFGSLPRSSAIAGGLTLAILVLPIIVTTTRQALTTVPITIKDAALALGASKLQIVFHHSLPIAMPTIVTGGILAVSRALGESAPLILIGMAAYITNSPNNIFDPATALPVQIYLWSGNPDIMFSEKAALAIFVLLAILSLINFLAQIIRKKYYTKL